MINLSSLVILMMKEPKRMELAEELITGQVLFFPNILDSFRRFVKEIGVIQNSEYGIDISKGLPKISDYGNIQIP